MQVPKNRSNDGPSPRVPVVTQTCSMGDLIVYNDTAKDCVQQWIGLVRSHDKKTVMSHTNKETCTYNGDMIITIQYSILTLMF